MDTKSVVAFLAVGISSVSVGQAVFGNQYEAYMLMPSVAIASATVTRFVISPSGRRIVYRQETAQTPESLLTGSKTRPAKWFVYDRSSKATRTIQLASEPGDLHFLADETTLLLFGTNNRERMTFFNTESGQSATTGVGGLKIDYYGDLSYSPIVFGHTSAHKLVLVSPSAVPAFIDQVPGYDRYLLTGGDSNALQFEVSKGEGRFARTIRGTFDLRTMQWSTRPITPEEREQSSSKLGGLRLTDRNGTVDLIMAPVPSMVYSPREKALVPFEVKPASSYNLNLPRVAKICLSQGPSSLSLDQRLVVYLDGGSLLAREIKPISLELAEKQALEDIKVALLKRAEQVGMGFLVMATDMDGDLPLPSKWEDTVQPYMRDRGMTDGFNYTFRGGNASQFDSTSTELGYFNGPGGRATVYLDGSTKWVPNP